MINDTETIVQDMVDAKINLVKIQQLCDEAILRKVSLDSECKALEARRADEEKKIEAAQNEVALTLVHLADAQSQLSSTNEILSKAQDEIKQHSAQIAEERLAIDTEKKELTTLRDEISASQARLVSSQIENEKLSQENADKAQKIKEFANSI